jgi:CHAD domain-containing protein
LRIALALVRRALASLERTSANPARDAHQTRVALKALRAIFRLVRPVLPKGVYQRENARLREAAKNLGPFRDAAVLRRTLKEAQAKVSLDQRSLAKAAARLAADFQTGKDFRRDAFRSCAAALRKSAVALRALRRAKPGWKMIGPGFEYLYRRNRACMKLALRGGEDDNYHHWRKNTKFLLYQSRILSPIWPACFHKLEKNLDKLQKCLGKDHDLVMFRHFVKESGAFDEKERRKLGRWAKRCACRLRKRSAALGKEIFSLRPGRLKRKLRRRWSVLIAAEPPLAGSGAS